MTVPAIINGCWQLSQGHRAGTLDVEAVLDDLERLVDAGLTTFDGGDIYVGVETLLGRLIVRRGRDAIRVHTKFVPDLDVLPTLGREDVDRIVDRSLARLGVERLDLVQLHWWDFDVPAYVEAAGWLSDLERAGKIAAIGATNFDVPHLTEIIDAGVEIASHQVQYSVLDTRPERGMAALCRRHGIDLLCYGALAGGFLSRRFVGAPDPAAPLANRSLVKYRLIIEEAGGWAHFQALLAELDRIARKHDATIANVATRFVLDQGQVTAVILGARDARHLPETLRSLEVELDDDDHRALRALIDAAPGPAGDVYALERERGGPHGAIMRYDLNRTAPDA